MGGTKELEALLLDVAKLKQGIPSELPEFFGFMNWSEVEEFSKTKEGEELATLVRLVTEFGEQTLIQALRKTVPKEGDANRMVSTAHKAKGREWSRVMLAGDFSEDRIKKGGADEIRLFYVALTRAKTGVSVPCDLSKHFNLELV